MPEETSQEKTEEATPHRREQAIEKGDVVHSRELVTAGVVLGVVLALPVIHPLFVRTCGHAFEVFLRFHAFAATDLPSFRSTMLQAVWIMAPLLLPVFALIMVAGLAANLIQVGWRVSTKKLEPKPEKLDPVKGFTKLLGRRSAAEAVRTILKFLIIGVISVTTVTARMEEIVGMHRSGPHDFIPQVATMMWIISWRVALLMIAFAVLDYGYQRWDWGRRLRMSRQELKEELKEREGNPLIKQRIRSIQAEQARRRMMADVPTATAVVTNPTHCAVALRYRPGEDTAPTVVAKGVDFLAAKIREVAERNGVPCVENKTLAWALHRGVKIGREVPAHLYRAVAEILAHVFRLGGEQRLERVRRGLETSRRSGGGAVGGDRR
jgi:flagellar biosynthetic protein FlhB